MSVKCSDIINAMEEYAPSHLAEDWDNVGLMVGCVDKEINTALVALDINDAVIDEAININADMIITHHPFIFRSIKNVNNTTPLGRRIIKLIKNDVSVFSAHTNLDMAVGGTNATLARLLNLKQVEGLVNNNGDGTAMGRIGYIEKQCSFAEFAESVKKVLGADKLSICGDKNRIVKTVAICTGKGASFLADASAMGADVYITGDFGYHEGQTAQDLGICVIDGTHYLTEVIIVPVLCKYLMDKFDISVYESKVNAQTLEII